MPRTHCLTRQQDMLLSALSLSAGPHSLVCLVAEIGAIVKRPRVDKLRRDAEQLVERGLAVRVGANYARSEMKRPLVAHMEKGRSLSGP